MRLTTVLVSAATLALLSAAPATAADFVAQAGVNANVFANASCSNSTANVTGHAPVRAENVCTRSDIGTGHAADFASFAHLGSESDASSHNGDSLGAGASGQADFTDFIVFSQANGGGATTTDVTVNLLLEGVLAATAAPLQGGGAGAGVEGFLLFNNEFFNFRYERFSDGTTSERNSFITNGDLLTEGRVAMHTPLITVGLNTPIQFRLHLETGVGTSGPASFALADFAQSSFKLPTNGPAFGLADGFTANAGDYLVDNRFIDPLAPAAGGVPEPTSWAMLIVGFGLSGVVVRRRRQLA